MRKGEWELFGCYPMLCDPKDEATWDWKCLLIVPEKYLYAMALNSCVRRILPEILCLWFTLSLPSSSKCLNGSEDRMCNIRMYVNIISVLSVPVFVSLFLLFNFCLQGNCLFCLPSLVGAWDSFLWSVSSNSGLANELLASGDCVHQNRCICGPGYSEAVG